MVQSKPIFGTGQNGTIYKMQNLILMFGCMSIITVKMLHIQASVTRKINPRDFPFFTLYISPKNHSAHPDLAISLKFLPLGKQKKIHYRW